MGKAVLLKSSGSGGGVGKLAESVPQTLAGDPLSGGSPCSTAPTGSPQELCVLPTVVRLGVMTAWVWGAGSEGLQPQTEIDKGAGIQVKNH